MTESRATAVKQTTASGDDLSLFVAPQWVLLALVLLATCVVYGPALRGDLLWDDNAHVTKAKLQSLTGLARIWFDVGATQQYYPLTHTAFWFEHQLWGDATLGYHIVNLLLHLAAVCLVYAVLRKLEIPGALLAAAIFALHPLQVESVAWISEQKNTLSAVFYLSAMLTYLKFDESRAADAPLTLPSPRRGEGWWYWLALGLFIAGLLSKTVTATLPAALLVIFWWQRGALTRRRDVRPLVPFFVLGAIFGVLTALVEHHFIGASGDEFNLTVIQRVLMAGRVIWFYLGKLLWPADLMFFYPRWDIDPAQWWQWLFPLAAVAMVVVLWAVCRTWRAPLAAWLFFVGTLFPALGFVNVYPFKFSYVADHFQYLASLGPITIVAGSIGWTIARMANPGRLAALAACGVGVVVLATITWWQTPMYGDARTLYTTIIEKNPTCWLAYNNLGFVLLKQSPPKDTIPYFERALELKPNFVEAQSNLGTALSAAGRGEEAIQHFEEVLRQSPDFGWAHFNLGTALGIVGRTEEAIREFEEAIRLEPDMELVQAKLGTTLFNTGRPQEAIPYFELALRRSPNDPEIHNSLGAALFQTGQQQEALVHLNRAVALAPDLADARKNLGKALFGLGRPQESIANFQQALVRTPNDPDTHNNLGTALFQAGERQQAIQEFEEALRLRPDFSAAYTNLGTALFSVGRPQDAIKHFVRWTKLQPDSIEAWASLASAHARANSTSDAIAAGEKARDLARSKQQTELAEQLDAWITSQRAEPSTDAKNSPANSPAP